MRYTSNQYYLYDFAEDVGADTVAESTMVEFWCVVKFSKDDGTSFSL